MKSAEEILKNQMDSSKLGMHYEWFSDFQATKESVLKAMEEYKNQSLAGVREALEEAVRVLEKCKIIANSTEKQVITRAVEKGKAALGFQD